jgi:hypothetical protein
VAQKRHLGYRPACEPQLQSSFLPLILKIVCLVSLLADSPSFIRCFRIDLTKKLLISSSVNVRLFKIQSQKCLTRSLCNFHIVMLADWLSYSHFV